MVGRGIVAHRLSQPPLLLQPVVALLLELANGMRREELACDAPLCQLESDSFRAVFAKLEGAGVPRIGPGAAGAVEPVRLVHRQQRSRALERDALFAQHHRGRVQGTPATGGGVVRLENRATHRFDNGGLGLRRHLGNFGHTASRHSGTRSELHTGTTSGLLLGKLATVNGSTFRCWATSARGVWASQSESDTAAQ